MKIWLHAKFRKYIDSHHIDCLLSQMWNRWFARSQRRGLSPSMLACQLTVYRQFGVNSSTRKELFHVNRNEQAMPTFDPIQYKQTTYQQWQAAAQAWNQWGPTIEQWLGPATEIMLD